MDIEKLNETILKRIEKRNELGKTPAPCRGGNYNDLIEMRRYEEKILKDCIDAFNRGARFEVR